MEEQTVSATLKNSLQSSKDFVAKKYHNLTNFVTKTYTTHKGKRRNKINEKKYKTSLYDIIIAKYTLVYIDILYLLTSLIMISIGVFGRILFLNFRLAYQFDLLPICWIATGAILLFVSLFGLIGAFRESTVWTNIFGILMTIVFIAQISTAIYAFQFVGHSKEIASRSIDNLINAHSSSYQFVNDENSPWAINWIQRNLQCCGNGGPSDWNKYPPYRRSGYYYQPKTTTFSIPLPNRMPSSCCRDLSNYNDLTCESYYENGCISNVDEMISAITLFVASMALAIAVLEVLGIVIALSAARILRKNKSTVRRQLNDILGNSTANRDETIKAGGNVETI